MPFVRRTRRKQYPGEILDNAFNYFSRKEEKKKKKKKKKKKSGRSGADSLEGSMAHFALLYA
jgi:hypothetical protein